MAASTAKDILWNNVSALMERHFGGENLTRLAEETGLGQGGGTRIKNRETSVRLSTLEKLAERFGVQPWQLLAPDLGAGLYALNGDRRLVPMYSEPAPGLLKTEPQKRRRRGKIAA